jgi:hypothetical protein
MAAGNRGAFITWHLPEGTESHSHALLGAKKLSGVPSAIAMGRGTPDNVIGDQFVG